MMPVRTSARDLPPAAAAILTAAAWLAVAASPSPADTAEPERPAAVSPTFFAERIRPLLERRCIECHGEDTAEGGLRLDSLAGLAKGGKAGPVIRPANADESLLVQAVRRLDESLAMPPERPLDKDEIALLVEWIAGGAPHPDGPIPAATSAVAAGRGRDFWSLKAPVRADPPPVSAALGGTVAHPIDAFILAALESRGLAPTAIADKPTLIRRATFTLTGLPPTPDEIDAFLADRSPDAFAKVVDRLLASPHYGEHWARHWLDVVRYADSNGLDENIAHGNAWRYRDWCIRALNDDVPFDRFLREQIAGDLLAADQTDESRWAELFVATGFLSLGPKAIAEGDQAKLVMDIIDEQIDTTGRAVLGLSLGCARCHDHKFDPISQADYYALAGIFKSTKTMESLKRLAKWHETVIATAAEQERFNEHEARIAAGKKGIETFLADTRRQLAATTVAGQTSGDGTIAAPAAAAKPPAELPEETFPDEAKAKLKELRETQKKLEADLPVLAAAMGVAEGTPEETRIHVRGSHLMLGQVVPRGVPVVLQLDGPLAMPAEGSGRRELADWLVDPRHPLTARVLVNRLWRWHFGRGIVRSTDNFGLTGEQPTNQPLLDWLAIRLVESGWSLKAMHRLILLSQTWQRSSDPATSPTAAACLQADVDNMLWWRADVRRLEAESIRDAMLAASGRLDRTMGGSLLHVANRAFIFDHTSKDETRYETGRRSIYLPVIRNHISDALWLFDCTDGAVGSGDRPTSTVASQALYLLNGDFVITTAEAIATSLVAAAPHDTETRTLLLFRRLFGRRPTAAEVGLVRRSLDTVTAELTAGTAADRDLAAWTAVCQAVLVGNEFVMMR